MADNGDGGGSAGVVAIVAIFVIVVLLLLIWAGPRYIWGGSKTEIKVDTPSAPAPAK
jgi:ABC-type phosphate transport system auxiliary subunit